MSEQFQPGGYKVLYAYTIPDLKSHEGLIKVGDATLHSELPIDELVESCQQENGTSFFHSSEIEAAAKKRIDQQLGTGGVRFELLWCALAVKQPVNDAGERITDQWVTFRDYEVHDKLQRFGVKRTKPDPDGAAREWFATSLEQVKEVFHSVQTGDSVRMLTTEADVAESFAEIVLRKEQADAVAFTKRKFVRGTIESPKEVLWSAIMRFGKTLSSYQLVKDHKDINKVLIITHRPVVSDGWFEDFNKIFKDEDMFQFASKRWGMTWDEVKNVEKFFYFASIQDLRGSFGVEAGADTSVTDSGSGEVAFSGAVSVDSTQSHPANEAAFRTAPVANLAGVSEVSAELLDASMEVQIEDSVLSREDVSADSVFKKNEELFNTEWDLIITDEAHEGTKTVLAQEMYSGLSAKYWLHLSGTPFNISEEFNPNDIYTWDYVQERKACEAFETERPLEVNPYGSLPTLDIYTYNISENFKQYDDPDNVGFDFATFFATEPVRKDDGTGKMVATGDYVFKDSASVENLLNLITKTRQYENEERHFPFESYEMKKIFAHTFWLLPSVQSTVAMKKMLQEHSYFGDFEVVNVTGANFEGDSALQAVQSAIKNNDRTITLSVGRLTTGVTVPEWTAVFMMSNMKSPMLYMQTIFRVKSSGSLPNGQVKDKGYVFDFAPDRTLEMVATAADAVKERSEAEGEEPVTTDEAVAEMLNYLPVISANGSAFDRRDTFALMNQLNRVFISRTLAAGFETRHLYDAAKLRSVDSEAVKKFLELQKTVGKHQKSGADKLKISESQLTENERKLLEENRSKKKVKTEDKKNWDDAKKKDEEDKKNARNLVAVLNSVSVRIPLLVFAADLTHVPEQRITLDNFPDLIDDQSWEEFMPRGFTKHGDEDSAGDSWDFVKDFYNSTIFVGACEEVRARVMAMDELPVMDRVVAIARLFGTLKNPDKETILTPWKVVGLQYSSTLGGLRWVDENDNWFVCDKDGVQEKDALPIETIEDYNRTISPQWTDEPDFESFWNSSKTTIMDINSKTALYPLYAAVSLWFKRRAARLAVGQSVDDKLLWNQIVEKQIFVNCRVPYSASIAKRVLSGYNDDVKVNTTVVDILAVREALKNARLPKFRADGELARAQRSLTDDEVSKVWKWVLNPEAMKNGSGSDGVGSMTEERVAMVLSMSEASVNGANEDQTGGGNPFGQLLDVIESDLTIDEPELFTAVVSNPPYQEVVGGEKNSALAYPIWQDFIMVAAEIAQKISFINPARWQKGGSGTGLTEIREWFAKTKCLKSFYNFEGADLFPSAAIAGGICIEFIDRTQTFYAPILTNGIKILDGERIKYIILITD